MRRWRLLSHCLERISEFIQKVLRKSHFWNPGLCWHSSTFLLCIILVCGFRRQLFGPPSLYTVSLPRPVVLWLADLTYPQLDCLSVFFPPYSAHFPESFLFPYSAMICRLLFLYSSVNKAPKGFESKCLCVGERRNILLSERPRHFFEVMFARVSLFIFLSQYFLFIIK